MLNNKRILALALGLGLSLTFQLEASSVKTINNETGDQAGSKVCRHKLR